MAEGGEALSSILTRLSHLEQLSDRRTNGVFILTRQDAGDIELLQAGTRFVRKFFRTEAEAIRAIPNGCSVIIDDL